MSMNWKLDDNQHLLLDTSSITKKTISAENILPEDSEIQTHYDITQ